MQLFSSPDSPKPETFAALVDRLGGAESIEALARRHSAFHRARHIKSAADLLRLILAYAPGGRSLRKLAAEAAASGVVDVSDVALLTPFRRCGDWLIALCENLLARRDESAGERAHENGVRLIDGSRIEGPGKTCFRLHLCYDVAGQRIADFAITPLDKGETLDRVGVQPGDIAIADRGYPQPDGTRATRDDLLRRRGTPRHAGHGPQGARALQAAAYAARHHAQAAGHRRARPRLGAPQRPQGSTRRRPAHLEGRRIHDLDHLARRDRLPASIARPPLSRSLANRIGLQTIEIDPAPRPVARQGSRARPSPGSPRTSFSRS